VPDARRIRQVAGAVGRAPSRIRTLTAPEVLLLVQAPAALPLAALGLNRWGLGRVQAFLARRPVRRRVPADPDVRRREIERIAWTVKIAAMYGPWRANCLQRSVVLWWFLRRRGHGGDLRISVRRDRATGGLDFHAWIEYEGAVLNDQPDVRTRYATFDRVIAPRDARFD
jgi:hypothetical protein